MPELGPEQLARLIKDHFAGLARRYGLERSAVYVEPLSHAGRIQRRSLTISDGEIKYHLKLAYSPQTTLTSCLSGMA